MAEYYSVDNLMDVGSKCKPMYTKMLDQLRDKIKKSMTDGEPDVFIITDPASSDLDFTPLECLHPDLKITLNDAIWFEFDNIELGCVEYDRIRNKFRLMQECDEETPKGESLCFLKTMTFHSLLHLIITSHLRSEKTPEQIELIFEKMEFERS